MRLDYGFTAVTRALRLLCVECFISPASSGTFYFGSVSSFIIKRYDLSKGSLLIDDTERARCKRTRKIGKAHKIREKKTSDYING